MKITHSFVSEILNAPAPGEVGPDDWNADHAIEGVGLLAFAEFSGAGSTTGTEQVVKITSGSFDLQLTSPTVETGEAWGTYFKNRGLGVVNLIADIDGGGSWTLGPNSGVFLVYDGTEWMVF